jgi:hypothetical protein
MRGSVITAIPHCPCRFGSELVASFTNPSNLLQYEEKTHTCAADTLTEHTGKTRCDHAHPRLTSVTACHAFF